MSKINLWMKFYFLGAIGPGEFPEYGGVVSEGLYGPYHQHFFNMRIDWMLDGPKNSLVEVNCESMPKGSENPAGNGWIAKETLITKVGDARRLHDATKGRLWKIINPNVKNHLGRPVAYKLVPSGPACYPMCDIDSGQGGRSAMARYHLWATCYHPDEFYSAGRFPNQSKGDTDGVATYVEKHKDDSLVECDLVTWYTFGCTHLVRPEDWPVMPVETVGFRLMPTGFFAGSPALDVPPSTPQHCTKSTNCSAP